MCNVILTFLYTNYTMAWVKSVKSDEDIGSITIITIIIIIIIIDDDDDDDGDIDDDGVD